MEENNSLLAVSFWDARAGVAVCSHLPGWGKPGGPAVLHRLGQSLLLRPHSSLWPCGQGPFGFLLPPPCGREGKEMSSGALSTTPPESEADAQGCLARSVALEGAVGSGGCASATRVAQQCAPQCGLLAGRPAASLCRATQMVAGGGVPCAIVQCGTSRCQLAALGRCGTSAVSISLFCKGVFITFNS